MARCNSRVPTGLSSQKLFLKKCSSTSPAMLETSNPQQSYTYTSALGRACGDFRIRSITKRTQSMSRRIGLAEVPKRPCKPGCIRHWHFTQHVSSDVKRLKTGITQPRPVFRSPPRNKGPLYVSWLRCAGALPRALTLLCTWPLGRALEQFCCSGGIQQPVGA